MIDLDQEIARLKYMHEQVVRANQSTQPMVVLWKEGVKKAIIICRPFEEDDKPQAFGEMVSLIPIAQADEVLLCADTWLKSVEPIDGMSPENVLGSDEFVRPSLDPMSVEALHILYYSKEIQTFKSSSFPYAYDDYGNFFWKTEAEHHFDSSAEDGQQVRGLWEELVTKAFAAPKAPLTGNEGITVAAGYLRQRGHTVVTPDMLR